MRARGRAAELVREALDASGPDTLVTDVGSTKQDLVERTSDPRFVGGHPIAGAETAASSTRAPTSSRVPSGT